MLFLNTYMVDELDRFCKYGVATELGYPCGHRRLQNCLLGIRSPGYCQRCLHIKTTEIDQFSGALIIPMKVYAVNHRKDTSNTPFLQSVPEQVQLGDTAYTLSACIFYGDGSHFVSIVRDFSTKRLLFCDGMMNNAQFIDYKASSGAFPLILLRKELQFAYFVRSEYVTSSSQSYI